jgi:hypothetical protein
VTSRAQPRLSEVLKALRACAPGVEVRLKKHHYWVFLGPRVYRALPKGSGHGSDDPQIEFGHVSKMCRMLGISVADVEAKLGLKK